MVLSISLVIPLSGCFNAIPEMSEEEEAKVVRYMADAVLAKDVNYQSRLLDEEEKQKALEEEARKAEELEKIKQEEQKKKEEKEAKNSPDDVKTTVAVKTYGVDEINDYLGIDGVEFEFVGEEIVDKYPKSSENLGFAFTASEGNKLMIMKFNICNVSADEAYVDLAAINPKFKVIINDTDKVSSSKVPLDDVMNFFTDTVSAGEVRQCVLIYELADDVSIDSLDLSISAFGKDAIKINLK